MNPSTSIAALLVALVAAGSYWAGDHHRDNAWLAKLAIKADSDKKALDAEIDRSRKATAAHVAEQQALQNSYQHLELKFHDLVARGPLVVFRAAAASAAAPGGGVASSGSGGSSVAAAGDAGNDAGAGLELAGSARAGAVDMGAGLGLSLGAVWVWNSALTGDDAPAGACGADDTTGAACALDSGLGLADAWQNHISNAKACAVDRLRYQRLIDYLQAHESKGVTP